MLYGIVERFLYDAEQNHFLLRFQFEGFAAYHQVGFILAGVLQDVQFVTDGLPDTGFGDLIAMKAAAEVAQIVDGLAHQFFSRLKFFLRVMIEGVQVEFGQAEHLPHVVVDLLADVLQGLFLYLELGLEEFCSNCVFMSCFSWSNLFFSGDKK